MVLGQIADQEPDEARRKKLAQKLTSTKQLKSDSCSKSATVRLELAGWGLEVKADQPYRDTQLLLPGAIPVVSACRRCNG